jgi:hypothetical protein
MKKVFITALVIAMMNEKNEETKNISSLNQMLDELDKNKSNIVTIDLTKSNVTYKFVKVAGNWGILCTNHTWEELCIVDDENLNKFNKAISETYKQNILNI